MFGRIEIFTIALAPVPPASPSTPGATAIGTGTITWTWTDNSSNETGFKVWDDPGAGAPATLRTTTAADATSWQHSGLSVNTQHTFQVAATNVVGDSAKTVNFTAWTLAAVPVAPVVGNPTVSTLDLSVGAGDGNPAGTGYALRCATTSQWVQADGTLGAAPVWQTAAVWGTKTVSGLANTTTYSFDVQARNGAGTATAFGPAAGAATLTPPPNPPSDPSFSALAVDSITWVWTDNSSNETGFKVYDDPGAGAPVTLQTTTAADVSSWQHTGLTPNTQYTFQVAATNAGGDSARTTEFSAWTRAAVPVAPVIANPGGHSLDLSIGAGDGNPAYTEYALYCTSAGLWVQADGTLGAPWVWRTAADWGTATVTGLAEYSAHSFAAVARNGFGMQTAGGPEASGTTLDVTPPTGTVEINGGGYPIINNPVVTLSLTYGDGAGTGVVDMRFSNDNADWGPWIPAADTAPWTLSAGDGAKDVYVQFRDGAGNVNTLDIGDGVLLDTAAPTVVVTLPEPTPTQATVLRFGVVFSEFVFPTFTAADVTLTGGLAGTVAVALDEQDPAYIVTVTLTGPNPDGAAGIQIGADVADGAGNPFAGASSAQYDVVHWPGFAAPLTDARGYAGHAGPVLDASIAAGGARVPLWQWKWDDGSKAEQDGPATAAWNLGTLAGTMAGEYWCVVNYGGLVFETVHAQVSVAADLAITGDPADQTVTEGGAAAFTVAAAGGYAPLHYQWKKDGDNLPGGPDGPELSITDATSADGGDYSVEVYDSHTASIESAAATLTVESGAPVAGGLGLAALALAAALGGARTLRRR